MADAASLASALDAVTAQVPREIAQAFEKSFAEFTAAGLAVGDRAPGFTLPNAVGRPVSLADRLAAGPVVLVFYRGEWCPYCNLHLRALQAALPDMQRRGASLLAVSPQTPDHSLSMTNRAELEFDVLSDAGQRVIRDYRVQFPLPAELQALHLDAFQLDVRLQNADDSWNLPIPATFVINRQGTVVAADVQVDYRRRMEPAEILRVLGGLP